MRHHYPNKARMTEYNLHEMWKSPNGTIRAILDGTVFRAPIVIDGISPVVKTWKAPITIARHAYGDVYIRPRKCGAPRGKAELVFTDAAGNETRETIYDFECSGVLTGQYNKDSSIEILCPEQLCLRPLHRAGSLVFLQGYHCQAVRWHLPGYLPAPLRHGIKAQFEEKGLTYFYTLIDDAIARVVRSQGASSGH